MAVLIALKDGTVEEYRGTTSSRKLWARLQSTEESIYVHEYPRGHVVGAWFPVDSLVHIEGYYSSSAGRKPREFNSYYKGKQYFETEESFRRRASAGVELKSGDIVTKYGKTYVLHVDGKGDKYLIRATKWNP